ncbi:MAG: MarR family transcriptional regulator [Deltaproteobacteria bacterium]|nr:MarR family transcriptional regulator [Deltaproteobacteria bacterium]MBW1737535.1 MarR family transcriptional regulator [Deltaproteobacteria bacterium]MBW1910907.1 MarR family transcriptional regulator [Deltaproteobacteria bacterium]MBW2033798.1 MarR family transcriptional regulator [Deltaproteobacteria bacterium]MBW2115501.1 MarR family transcriptional regulator [Deltaproteobacteria bacterium]
MTQYEDCIIFLLAKAYQKAHANFKGRLLTHGLTPVQHLILEAVWEDEGISAGDIGKKLVLDNATLSGVLDRMAERGWIFKATDESDKRFIRIYLTDKAKEMKPLLIEERKRANEEILGGLTLEEKVVLKRLLRDIQH